MPRLIAWFVLAAVCQAQSLPGTHACEEADSVYERDHYVVRAVRLASSHPAGMGTRSLRSSGLTADLGFESGSPFTSAVHTIAQQRLRDRLLSMAIAPGEIPRLSLQTWLGSTPPGRFTGGQVVLGHHLSIALVTAALENCDPIAKQLDVVYKMFYTGRLPMWLLRTGFSAAPELTESGIQPNAPWNLRIFPAMAYDSARNLFGGIRLASRKDGGLLNGGSLAILGSTSSLATMAGITGARDFPNRLISSAEWRFGHTFSRFPADSLRLAQGTMALAVAATTRTMAGRDLQMRFGAAIEGGNRQADLSVEEVQSENTPRSGYGGLKNYTGLTYGFGRNLVGAAYAWHLGNTGNTGVEFAKQIVDLTYSRRFLPHPHRPILAAAFDKWGLAFSAILSNGTRRLSS